MSLILSNYLPGLKPNLPAIVIGSVDLFLLIKYKVSIPRILLLSAAMGFVLFGILG